MGDFDRMLQLLERIAVGLEAVSKQGPNDRLAVALEAVSKQLEAVAEPPIRFDEPDGDELITTTEVAAYMGVTGETVRNWNQRRTGPTSYKINGRYMYRRAEVIAYREARSQFYETIRRQPGRPRKDA